VSAERAEGVRRDGWGLVARLFHWGVGSLVLVTIAIGAAMTSAGFEGIRNALYVGHKSIGVLILVAVPLRALWRLVTPTPELPSSISPRERRLAHATHLGLYALLLIMAVTGYLRTVGGGYPIEVLDALGVPPLVGEMEVWADRFSVIHAFTAYLLVAAIATHVAAVGYHAMFGERRILSRMWPPFASGRGDAQERRS
jgi:cytochrome b561